MVGSCYEVHDAKDKRLKTLKAMKTMNVISQECTAPRVPHPKYATHHTLDSPYLIYSTLSSW